MTRWIATIIAAIVSAYACAVVAQFGTPIDNALPLIVAGVVIVAALTRPAMAIAVPLLIGSEIAIADERLRLVSFGLIVAVVAAVALAKVERPVVIAVAAILLLRWIPISSVILWRELLLLAIAIGIVYALRDTPFGVAIAIATALFTPLIPLRTIGYAVAVLIAAAIVWLSGTRVPRLTIISSFYVAVIVIFFPWSGVLARGPAYAVRGLPIVGPRMPMQMALAPGQSIAVDVPPDASALILSGANVSRLKPGTLVGRVDSTPLRIGDIADWGFLRREHFHGARNRVPRNPAGEVRGYGLSAWVDGAARFPVSTSRVIVSADPRLPKDARLQIDAFELGKR